MRILLGISMLVLVAILWTGISILRHIRLTRRRNKFLRDQQNSEQVRAMPPLRSLADVAPLPARFAAPLVVPRQSAEELADVAFTESIAARGHNFDSLPIAAPAFVEVPRTAAAEPAPVAQVQLPRVPLRQPDLAPLRIMEVAPETALRDIFPSAPAFPTLAAAEAEAPPPPIEAPPPPALRNMRRPVRSVHSQAEGARPANRPDWIYFNKDMGDLSDPAPSRIRVRSR